MKKIFVILLCASLFITLVGCNKVEENQNNIDFKYKIALVCDYSDTQEEGIGVEIFNSIESYYNTSKNPAKKYHPQSNKSQHIISSINTAINDSSNVITVIGNEYGNAVSSIAAEYPHITFVIIGMSDAIALHNNVYCCNLDTDYLEFFKSILK